MAGRHISEDELNALENDPDWRAARQAEDDERQRQAAADRKASEPILDSLREVGWDVDSVWDLVNTPLNYPEAVPVLMRHIGSNRKYPDSVLEGMARALAVPFAPEAYPLLRNLYFQLEAKGVRDGIALALQQTGGAEKYDEILELTRDRALGPSRVLFISYFREHASPEELESLLREFQTDPELEPEATYWLKKRSKSKRSSGPPKD